MGLEIVKTDVKNGLTSLLIRQFIILTIVCMPLIPT